MPGQTDLSEGISPSVSTIYICIALVLILVSLLCNIAVMTTIYSRKETNNPKDWFILNISLCDIVSTLFATLSVDNVLMNWNIDDAFCKVSYAFSYAGYAAVILTLCAMTLERYYGICHTNTYQKRSISRKTTWIIPVIWVISVVLFAPYFDVYGRKIVKLVGGKTGRVCDETWSPLISGGIYFIVVPLLLLTVVVPVTIAVILVQTMRTLRVSRTPSSGGSAVLHQKRKQTMKMILYMTIIHYICWLPTVVLKLADAYGAILPRFWIMLAVFDLPHHARSIFYTLTYWIMYPGFKADLKSMCALCFCCARRRNTENNSESKSEAKKQTENKSNTFDEENDFFQ